MKTLVMERMPELFWQKIKEMSWESYFLEDTKSDLDKTEIIIIRTKTNFNKGYFRRFPDLKMIIRAGSGFDNIDIPEAEKRNIVVCNTPEANAFSAYEHTLSFIFALIKQHQKCKEMVLKEDWRKDFPANWEISDLKVLIVGVGRVGSRVAGALKFLGAEVKGIDPYLSVSEWKERGVEKISYKEGIEWCNLVTFHCPLTKETQHYFSDPILKELHNPVWLINTARGRIIDESVIESGLLSGKILGFASDVFSQEPWKAQNFAKKDNVLLSPHTGSFTKNAKARMSLETLSVWSEFVFNKLIISRIDSRFFL